MQGRLDVEEGGKRLAWEQVYKLRKRLKAEKEKGRKVREKMEKMRESRETGNEGGGQAGNVVEELREEIGRLVKEEAKLREEKAELGKRIGVIGRELEEAKRSNERMLHFSQKRVDRIKELAGELEAGKEERRLEGRIQDMKNRIEGTEKDKDREEEIARQRGKIRELEVERQGLNKEIGLNKGMIEEIRRQISEQGDLRREAQEKCKKLEELNQVRNMLQ